MTFNALDNNNLDRLPSKTKIPHTLPIVVIFCIWSFTGDAAIGNEAVSPPPFPSCLLEDMVSTEDGLCSMVEEAQVLLSRLAPSTASHLKSLAQNFDVERNLRVQQGLFREDLIWQERGFTEQQPNIMVYIFVSLSLNSAGELAEEFRTSVGNDPDSKVKGRLESVTLYLTQAQLFLSQMSPTMTAVSDRALQIYF